MAISIAMPSLRLCLFTFALAIGADTASAFAGAPQTGASRTGFHSTLQPQRTVPKSRERVKAFQSTTEKATIEPRSQPRTGLAQQLLNFALNSPLWDYVLVPNARASIVKTAEENNIPWIAAKEWLKSQTDAPWNDESVSSKYGDIDYPEYYKKPFHAYSEGNLSYDAAIEQELASRSIGARNFPKFGENGEDVFRGAFDKALFEIGAKVNAGESNQDVVIVDFGCGTGTSTRRMAKQYPQATKLVGIDLSPYFIDVGKTLLKLGPSAINGSNEEQSTTTAQGWITTIQPDPRIELRQGDMANSQLPSNSASVVNLSLVMHELPTNAAKDVISEAYRILKPGGQMWISEMDFEAPAYKAQRENALLFSLLRATEPYLDEYADGMATLRQFIVDTFGSEGGSVKIAAATGRHYALVAEKGLGGELKPVVLEDSRFRKDGSYALEDTHLKPWESKNES